MLQQNNIFEGHESVVLATDVNTEGTMLVTTSLDCKIRIFDSQTAKMLFADESSWTVLVCEIQSRWKSIHLGLKIW